MSGRISKFEITFVDNECFNRSCDVKDICTHYSNNPTSDQRDKFIECPCIQCNFFSDSRELTADETTDTVTSY